MTLKDFVSNGIQARAFRMPALPSVSAMAKTAEKIAAQRDAKTSLIAIDLEALHQKLRSFADGGKWDGFSSVELRHIPSCFWQNNATLLQTDGFLSKFFAVLQGSKSRLATKELIWTYLLHFDTDNVAIRDIGAYLSTAVGAWSWEWQARHRQHAIFNPDQGPRSVAAAALSSAHPQEYLATLGLRGPYASSRFAVSCFVHAAEATATQLRKTPSLELAKRLCSWMEGDAKHQRISSVRKFLADALLTPWLERDPSDEIRDFVRAKMLSLCGDPRIDRDGWIGVHDFARRVINRWLARASLEHFFAVVDRTALEHQWEARKAFWQSYIDRDFVQDAYVVFGTTGQSRARRLAEEQDDPSALQFGNLRGALADQAVLILQIGELVVCDWSHNGSLRIWKRENQHAPKFYERNYGAQNLRWGSDFDQRHVGEWQTYARSYITRNSGLR